MRGEVLGRRSCYKLGRKLEEALAGCGDCAARCLCYCIIGWVLEKALKRITRVCLSVLVTVNLDELK